MNKDLIVSVYDLLVNKRIELIDKLSSYKSRLEEIDKFLDDVENNNSDYKYFSPFSTDDIYDNKISEYTNEKNKLNEIISKLNDDYNEYDNYVRLIHDFLDSCETEDVVNKNIENHDVTDSCFDNNHLIHKLSIVSSFIKVDPNRAIDELNSCIDIIKNI